MDDSKYSERMPLRLSPELKEGLRKAAQKDHLTMSGFIRYHIARAVSKRLQASDQ